MIREDTLSNVLLKLSHYGSMYSGPGPGGPGVGREDGAAEHRMEWYKIDRKNCRN
jgi:hypothetical protein